MSLLVPIPQLQQVGTSSSLFVSEKPITLSCGPVTFGDGKPLSVFNQPKASYLIYRQLFGGIRQVLDNTSRTWLSPDPSVAQQKMFWNNKANTWQALILAMGNKDSSSNDIFASDPLTGFPKYAAQCLFTGTDTSGVDQAGQSSLSSSIEIIAAGQENLAGLTMEPSDPTAAEQIRIFLKNSALIEQGQVTILRDSAGFHVQMVAGGSTVSLSSSGEIVLSPSNGRPVQVNGDLAVSGNLYVSGVKVLVP